MDTVHPQISFLIPAYNEEQHLKITVEESIRVLTESGRDFEIIVVDDGSTDRTGKIAEELAGTHSCVRVFHNGVNRGFGETCRKGIREARGQYIGWVSADTTWEPDGLKQAVNTLGQADVITAYYTNVHDRSWLRRIISRSFTVFMNLLFGLQLHYFNGGCFHRADLIKPLELRSAGLTLWAEALIRLLKKGHSCREIGIYNPPRQQGRSKAFSFRNMFGTLGIIIILIRDIHFTRVH